MTTERVFNFHGSVVFNDIHDNKDCTIIVPKPEKWGDSQDGEQELSARIRRVYASGKCVTQSDWGVVFRLMSEEGLIESSAYKAGSEMINRICKSSVTTESAIRQSKAVDNLKGRYSDGWQMKDRTRESDGILLRYNEIAEIYLQ